MFLQPEEKAGARPRPIAERFQALLIVRSKLRFVVDSIPIAKDRWKILQDFQLKIYNEAYRARIRFTLLGGSRFPRIAVLFQPMYAVGSAIVDTSDVTFEILNSTGWAKPNPFLMDGVGGHLAVEQSDWSFEPAFRHILGAPTWVQVSPKAYRTPNLAPIHPGDIEKIARLVERQLGEPGGSRGIGVF